MIAWWVCLLFLSVMHFGSTYNPTLRLFSSPYAREIRPLPPATRSMNPAYVMQLFPEVGLGTGYSGVWAGRLDSCGVGMCTGMPRVIWLSSVPMLTTAS
ncbi:hypothetical protein GGR53DRAFT_489376, partial [Hypoxylon sp. FL1150]